MSANDLGLNLPHLPHSFDHQDPESSSLRLLQEFSPDWKKVASDDVKFTRFADGITNTLIKVTQHQSDSSDREPVLVRAYGSGTDTIIDRGKELRAHDMLANRGLASALLSTFENGFIYRFVPGKSCTAQDFHNPKVYRQIAAKMGEWHAKLPLSALNESSRFVAGKINNPKPFSNVWTNAQRWINALPSDTAQLKERNELFREELAWLSELLQDFPSLDGRELVFSHTDLLCGNVILEEAPDSQTTGPQSVTFIDYDYVTAAPAAFDVANFFAEWMGPELEHSWIPSKAQRLDFIEHYVRSFREHSDGPDNARHADLSKDVSHVYEQAELFRGFTGFYWGIWGLIQASISDIDFDYASYAELRHSEYWGWKAEYDGSRKQEGKEMTVREMKWAEGGVPK
jgi:ethanolamine kinase